jgi:hypothetical protein
MVTGGQPGGVSVQKPLNLPRASPDEHDPRSMKSAFPLLLLSFPDWTFYDRPNWNLDK